MSSLTGPRAPREKTIKSIKLPLAAGFAAYRGTMACLDTSSHTLKPGAAANANLINIGQFEEDFDNTAGASAVLVNVTLPREILCQWYDSVTGANAVTSASLFVNVYIASNHEVTTSAAGNSIAGRVWAVAADRGVLIQANQF